MAQPVGQHVSSHQEEKVSTTLTIEDERLIMFLGNALVDAASRCSRDMSQPMMSENCETMVTNKITEWVTTDGNIFFTPTNHLQITLSSL